MWQFLTNIKSQILQLSLTERWFIFMAMLCSFLISMDYAIVRPVSNSLFVTVYGAKFFPYAWMAVIPLNFLVVYLYNKFLPRLGCRNMFILTVGIILLINGSAPKFLTLWPKSSFLYYLWKEIYILVLYQQLWSVIHSTIKMDNAKYLYGIIFAIGGTGAVLGSSLPGFKASEWGSANCLWMTIPCLLLLMFFYTKLIRYSSQQKVDIAEGSNLEPKGSIKEGIKIIAQSKVLFYVLLLVSFMQISATIVYYQFNELVETTISQQDLRTELYGKALGIINVATVLLQLFGSFLLVQLFGLRRSHLSIPILLGISTLASLMVPGGAMIMFSFITIKAFDFSLFAVIKEMLYVPLSREEKFQAKAIIDVFAYRTSKVLASFCILFFEWLRLPFLSLSWCLLALFILWFMTVLRLFRLQELQPYKA